jgi:hypothetical protein
MTTQVFPLRDNIPLVKIEICVQITCQVYVNTVSGTYTPLQNHACSFDIPAMVVQAVQSNSITYRSFAGAVFQPHIYVDVVPEMTTQE